jgi:enolase
LQALHEGQEALVQGFYSYEESTNAGVPTVGATVELLLPSSGVVLRFRGSTPLGTSAGTGEAIHLVDSVIEGTDQRDVVSRHAAYLNEVEPGVFSFRKDCPETRIREQGDEALTTLYTKAQRYRGKGCLNAAANVVDPIGPAFTGKNAATLTLKDIDRLLLQLELQVAQQRSKIGADASSEERIRVMQRKQNLGMNAMLSVSLAMGRGVAHIQGRPLYELLREEMVSIVNQLAAQHGVAVPGDQFEDSVTALREVTGKLEEKGESLYETLRQLTGIYEVPETAAVDLS